MLVRCFNYCFHGPKIPIVLVWTGKALTVFHLEDNIQEKIKILSGFFPFHNYEVYACILKN